MEKGLKIATRGSRLALVQAYIIGELISLGGYKYRIVTVKSEGDKDLYTPLYEYGDRGLFVKAVNEEVLNGNADLAVHSAKDLPYDIGEELEISYYSERGDTRDFFVSHKSMEGFMGTVGGSSIRRISFLKVKYNNMEFKNLRGNIDTRITKWKNGDVDAMVLAKVALDRLGIDLPGEVIPEEILPPAPNQGIIAVVTRKGSPESNFFQHLQNEQSLWEGENERRLMGALSLGCNTAVSIRAYFDSRLIKFSYVNGNRRYDMTFNGYPDTSQIRKLSEIIYE